MAGFRLAGVLVLLVLGIWGVFSAFRVQAQTRECIPPSDIDPFETADERLYFLENARTGLTLWYDDSGAIQQTDYSIDAYNWEARLSPNGQMMFFTYIDKATEEFHLDLLMLGDAEVEVRSL
jgi:hypothetical protein